MLSFANSRKTTIGFFGIRLPAWGVAFLATFIFTVVVGGSNHVAAFGPICGIETGNPHDYAGAVVESVWAWPSGSQGGTADNTHVKFTTIGVQTPGGNVVHLASDHVTIINRQSSETFNQYDSGCGDGRNVVLGYSDGNKLNQTSNYSGSGLGHTTDGTVWALDCDISRHADHFEQYKVTGVGTPSGIPAGRTGSWNVVTTSGAISGPDLVNAAANGRTVNIRLVFTLDPVEPKPEPPPPGGYTITCIGAIARNGDGSGLGGSHGETYTTPGGKVWKTNTVVGITGISPGVAGGWSSTGGNGNGLVGYSDTGSWNFTATSTTITINVYRIYHNEDTGNWSYVPSSGSTTSITCGVPPPQTPPTGSLDGGTCGGAIDGWAVDPDLNTQSLNVELFVDGAYVGSYLANWASPDVPYPGNHRFHITGLPFLTDGAAHTVAVSADGISTLGAEDGLNAGLYGSPFAFAACRSYSYNPVPSAVAAPNDEEPTSITFSTTTGLIFTPSAGAPSCVNNVTLEHHIFKRTSAGVVTDITAWTIDGGAAGCLPNTTKTYPAYSLPAGTFDAGDQFCVEAKITPGAGLVDASGNQLGSPTVAFVQPPPGCVTIHNKPYFRAFNGSIRTGGDFAGTPCTSVGKGTLGGWNNNSGVPYGSGTGLAVIALLKATGVASGMSTSTSPPSLATAGSALSFANRNAGTASPTIHADSPILGGNYGASHCIDKPIKPTTTTPLGSSTVDVSTLASGAYTYSAGNLTLTASGPIGLSKNIAIFVTGANKVLINNNISYTTGGWNPTPTSTNIPSFTLSVTGGSIYLDPANVTQLDGIYLAAQAGGAGGKIYTCASGFSAMAASNLYGSCNNQLTVNGAFVANQINLMRTYGSMRNAHHLPAPCSHAGIISTPSTVTCASEVFRFSPELYLSNQPPPSNTTAPLYDSLTSLPPVL